MSSATSQPAHIPDVALTSLLQPVSAMIRNCLLTKNPELQNLDFTHLHVYCPTIKNEDIEFKAQVLVKQTASSTYKLESKQIFSFTRVDADRLLTELGLTYREFPKSDYDAVMNWLGKDKFGTVELVSGNIDSDIGDAVVIFRFGEARNSDGDISPRYIELGFDDDQSERPIKADYGFAIRGEVTFTFRGNIPDNTTENGDSENSPPEQELIDLSKLLTKRHIGNPFKTKTKGLAD